MIDMLTFILIFAGVGGVMAVVMAVKEFKKDQKSVEDEFGGQENTVKTPLFKRKPKDIEPTDFKIVMNPREVKKDGKSTDIVKAGKDKKLQKDSRAITHTANRKKPRRA